MMDILVLSVYSSCMMPVCSGGLLDAWGLNSLTLAACRSGLSSSGSSSALGNASNPASPR